MIGVREYLRSQGFKIIKVEVTDLTNSDYFDFNHMNHKGCLKYTKKFSDVLKQELAI